MLGNSIALIGISALFGVEAWKAGNWFARAVLVVLTLGFALASIFIKQLTDLAPHLGAIATNIFSQPLAWFVLAVALFLVMRPLWARSGGTVKTSRLDRLNELAEKGSNIIANVRYHRNHSWLGRDRTNGIVDTAQMGASLLISYEKEGLPIPKFNTKSAEKICIGLHSYFSATGPLIRDGHIKELESIAPGIVHHAEQAAMDFNPEDWYIE